jgi:hypothetical protein
MAKKNKKNNKNKSEFIIEKVSLEFILKLDTSNPLVEFFNTLPDESRQEILKGTIHNSLINSKAMHLLNADSSWAELSLVPIDTCTCPPDEEN